MSLENAKQFIARVKEDEALQKRTANQGEKEVMALAKEIGLEFTSDELKEAASSEELDMDSMEQAAGGLAFFKPMTPDIDRSCHRDPSGEHKWFLYYHYEHKYFTWLKDEGLWSRGFDVYKCSLCGRQKEEEV